MKSVRILFIVFIFVVSILSLFSCMDNDDYKPIYGGYATVQEYLGSVRGLILDASDVILVPTLSSLQEVNSLKGVERLCVYYTIPDGVVIDENTKEYEIDILPGYSYVIPTKSLTNRPDTLTNDSILQLSHIWAAKGYVNTQVQLYTGETLYADMVKEKVSNDTLYLRSNFKLSKGSRPVDYPFSFRLPTKTQLEQEDIKTVKDSIVIAVSAKVKDGSHSKTVTKYTKYKL